MNASACRDCPIDPLRVVDRTHHGTGPGRLPEQSHRRHGDPEAVRWVPSRHPEHDEERLALRRREIVEVAEQRPTDLVQAGIRELGFILHSADLDALQLRGMSERIVDQCGLADARFTAYDQRPAPPVTRAVDQPRQLLLFVPAS